MRGCQPMTNGWISPNALMTVSSSRPCWVATTVQQDCASRCRLSACCRRRRCGDSMKKQQVDHILRAAGRITGEKRFVIIGSQSLHGKYPDMADEIVMSAEVDLIAMKNPRLTDLLNEIAVDSLFHQNYGYYADPVDATTA